MATLDDINKQILREKESYSRDYNRLQKELLELKSRYQRNMANLNSQKENIKQANKQFEDYNKLLEIALEV